VLRATAGPLDGIAAVARLIDSPSSFRFVMSRIASPLDVADPLGPLQSILLHAATSSPIDQAPSRIPVMAGSFSEFDVRTVLQTVGFLRQHAEVEIRSDGALLGAIDLRANMVLRATAGSLDGVAAVQRLLEAPSTAQFAVFRTPAERDDVKPVGPLREVLPPVPARAEAPASRRALKRAWLVAPAVMGILGAAVLALRGAPTEVVSAQPASQASVVQAPIAVAPPPIVQAPVAPPKVEPLPQPTPVPPVRVVLNATDVAAAQTLLKKRGHDPGPIDGILGPRTAAAIRAFQRAEHLSVDGSLNAETRDALGP
jgi:hypothetical protein